MTHSTIFFLGLVLTLEMLTPSGTKPDQKYLINSSIYQHDYQPLKVRGELGCGVLLGPGFLLTAMGLATVAGFLFTAMGDAPGVLTVFLRGAETGELRAWPLMIAEMGLFLTLEEATEVVVMGAFFTVTCKRCFLILL